VDDVTKGSDASWLLRVVTGKTSRAIFSLVAPCDVIVGRDDTSALALSDPSVSRRHARFVAWQDRIEITDLVSQNGTFVNGRSGASLTAREGDRIFVGEVVLRVERGDATAETVAVVPLVRAFGERHAMSNEADGTLDVLPMSDVLRLFATTKKSLDLRVVTSEHTAEITFARGRIVGLRFDGAEVIGSIAIVEQLRTMLDWSEGTFTFGPPCSGDDARAALDVDEILGTGPEPRDDGSR
jgi:hypothetical protein